MKLSDQLRHRIINEEVASHTWNPTTAKPKHPTADEIYHAIVNSNPYVSTPAHKKDSLDQVNEIYSHLNDEEIKLPRPIAHMKRGKITISQHLTIEGDDCQMELRASKNSNFVRHDVEVRALKQECDHSLRRLYRHYTSLQELIRDHPHIGNQQQVIDALAHEKALRKASAERRKNPEPIVPIETKPGTSTAIAKARLLGAKFFNN